MADYHLRKIHNSCCLKPLYRTKNNILQFDTRYPHSNIIRLPLTKRPLPSHTRCTLANQNARKINHCGPPRDAFFDCYRCLTTDHYVRLGVIVHALQIYIHYFYLNESSESAAELARDFVVKIQFMR